MSGKTYSKDRFTSGLLDGTFLPRIWEEHTPIIYCHSASMNSSEALGYGQVPSAERLTRHLADNGWPVAAPTLDILWGNATSRSRISDALTWLRAQQGSTNPAVLIGTSMGAAAALSWAYYNPSDVAAVIGLIPAIDLEAIRVANTGSLRPSIDTAYAVSYPVALPAGANPASNTGTMNAVPQQFWYSTDDAVSANIVSYANAVGADLHSFGAMGHTNAAVATVDLDAILDFLAPFA